MSLHQRILLVIFASFARTAAAAPDLVIADFEGPAYGAWKTTGDAFGSRPARGTLPKQMQVSGYEGKGLVNSFHGGDRSTGTLTSPPFTIERPYISFLIGGGKHPGKTCVNLLSDRRVVRTATGPNDRPGGSEALDWQAWDVRELLGKPAVIQIVDQARGGWGHINVDHLVQTDRPRRDGPAQRQITIARRYLHLPVKNGARQRRMKIHVDGVTLREFEIELADGRPDFWVFCDLAGVQGKTATLTIDRLPAESQALAAIVQADDVPGAREMYAEKSRSQFHFSPRRGWTNDPNGLVYYAGEWHLYFQHNPYGWAWGNMHWGHAVSPDLVHWTELPIAIYPRQFGDWAFSGSAVVDTQNTSGFQKGSEPPLVVAYTSTGRGEVIVYSNDRGRTFTEYEGNPVVVHKGRDPKLIWYAPGKHWVMVVYDELDRARGLAFYTSPDLKRWTRQSRIEGYYECPELFELPVDGKRENTRSVVYAADGAYALGRFDGKQFHPETEKLPYNLGNCFYASQTYSDVPPGDGRRIQIAWGRAGHRDMPFNQLMDFPVELTLRTTADGIRMCAAPVREIALLHGRAHRFHDLVLTEGSNPLSAIRGDLFHIRAELAVGSAKELGLTVRGVPVVYDAVAGRLTCGDKRVELRPADGKLRLELLVDRLTLELFAQDGRYYLPMHVTFGDGAPVLEAVSRQGVARATKLEVFALHSAWPQGE